MEDIRERKKLVDIYNRLYSRFGSQNWWPADSKFEMIIGSILTQASGWSNVEKAISNLKSADLLNYNKIKDLKIDRLANLIRPSVYFNQKAIKIKNFIDYIERNYEGNLNKFLNLDIERLRNELLNISGIGKETADSIVLYAANKPVFVVDAYTKRIFSRVGYKFDDYDSLQELFHTNLKNDTGLFNEYHALIVRHAKEYCTKRNPRCKECPLNKMCNYGKVHR